MNIDEYFEIYTGGNDNIKTWTPFALKEFAKDYHKMKMLNLELDKNNVDLTDVMHRSLEQKEATYKKICKWFETEYDSSTSKETVAEYEKEANEINAQMKLLRHLIGD